MVRSAETLSLDKNKQREVTKDFNKLKNQVKSGSVTIKDTRKELKAAAEQKRGLLYISHLPHGFYETELRGYFQQFGKVTNVKVCRSNRTGNSKGYGYVEFANPEVAKIAAETMNNYLMFKKRVTAEYVPYEKRPKSIFLGKSSSTNRYSAKVRREKQYQKNVNVDEKVHKKRTISRVTNLSKKLQKLENMGIKTTFKPIDLTLIKQESCEGLATVESSPSCDKEVKIPLKKSTRSMSKTLSPKLSSSSTTVLKNKMVLAQSLDSVKTVLSPKKNEKIDAESTPLKKKTAKKALVVQDVTKTRKKTSNLKSITKKSKKPTPLNADTVRKIARELIRKKGDSLLNYQPQNTKQVLKKKTKK